MSNKPLDTPFPRLYLFATGIGFAGLVAWFFLGRELGVLDWAVTLVPDSHAGAGLMLGIMLMMLPGFLLWKLYNRWIERTLRVRGKFIEDDVYLPKEPKQKKPD
ncbi:hypothetical protein H9C73_07890 [Marinobacterium sp. AK62]|uniref:Uncharacterized protein n=1 Tax=Marinobacterium alkalitolerans TaxID=1542925 RepID=A0ABS3ZAD9_9GAMM|nr:hypothetical protein [Marinobacterium alkalitolerans]MBP0048655.1 hypothetical protein [Marinobacterium alkalitolerans]